MLLTRVSDGCAPRAYRSSLDTPAPRGRELEWSALRTEALVRRSQTVGVSCAASIRVARSRVCARGVSDACWASRVARTTRAGEGSVHDRMQAAS